MKTLVALGMVLVAFGAIAEDTTTATTTAKADAAAPVDAEFKPPPGFKTKKRGELVLYCMRDSTVGTRFKTEKCYDEAQIRDYLAAQQENKRDIERVRNTCSTGAGEYCRRQ
jgi:hypothetical protein